MKDLIEAVKEFDQRDKERTDALKQASLWSGHISLEMQMQVTHQRLMDALQMIAWMCDHIIELKKEKSKTE